MGISGIAKALANIEAVNFGHGPQERNLLDVAAKSIGSVIDALAADGTIDRGKLASCLGLAQNSRTGQCRQLPTLRKQYLVRSSRG